MLKTVAVVFSLAVAVTASTCTLSNTLRSAGATNGRFVGTCLANSLRTSDSTLSATTRVQFDLLTPENECKMDATEPSQGTFSFTSCDALYNFAVANNITFRGHTLLWGQQTASWMSSLSDSAKRAAIVSHIEGVLGHYKGKAYAWDVVNEAVNDSVGALKSTVWYPSAGTDYIDLAFTTARAVDPSARLFYNDYSIDAVNTKSTYVYNMVKSMIARGIPIDGVGFQMHISTSWYPSQSDMTTNFKRFAALGLELHITELDVGISSASEYDAQATVYSAAINTCLSTPMCKSFEVWGVSDLYTWRTGKMPLLFDSNFTAKPAACTVYNALISAPAGCKLSALPTGAAGWGTCWTRTTSGSNCTFNCSSGYSAVVGKCSSGTWITSPACSGGAVVAESSTPAQTVESSSAIPAVTESSTPAAVESSSPAVSTIISAVVSSTQDDSQDGLDDKSVTGAAFACLPSLLLFALIAC